MPIELRIEVDAKRLALAWRRKPARLRKEMGNAVGRIAAEIAREAKLKAPSAFSHLKNSIRSRRQSALSAVVRPHMAYAPFVEYGVPASEARMPPLLDIQAWVRVKGIVPQDPADSERDLAWKIARSIARKGTPAQPYLLPAADAVRPRAQRRVARAIDRALEARA